MKTLILLIIAAACSSCAYTKYADGSESFALDGEQAARAIQVFADK